MKTNLTTLIAIVVMVVLVNAGIATARGEQFAPSAPLGSSFSYQGFFTGLERPGRWQL